MVMARVNIEIDWLGLTDIEQYGAVLIIITQLIFNKFLTSNIP